MLSKHWTFLCKLCIVILFTFADSSIQKAAEAYLYPQNKWAGYPDMGPEKAVDNSVLYHYFDVCAATDYAYVDGPWWTVNLGGAYRVESIAIQNINYMGK